MRDGSTYRPARRSQARTYFKRGWAAYWRELPIVTLVMKHGERATKEHPKRGIIAVRAVPQVRQ